MLELSELLIVSLHKVTSINQKSKWPQHKKERKNSPLDFPMFSECVQSIIIKTIIYFLKFMIRSSEDNHQRGECILNPCILQYEIFLLAN